MEIIALTGIASTDSIELNGNSGTQQIVATGTIATKGDTGATGPTGATGEPGTNGQGVPTGGTTGQQLAKINGTDYNTQWVNPVDISGKADTSTLTAHTSNTSNPHSVTKAQVGLGSVPNTDFTASIAAKQDTLVSGTTIKTINSTSILGSGDIVISGGGGGGTWGSITGTLSSQTDLNSALTGKEDLANKDTDITLAANSDTKYPSQKAVKTYVDNNLETAPIDKAFALKYDGFSAIRTAIDDSTNNAYDLVIFGDSVPMQTFNAPGWTWQLGDKFARAAKLVNPTKEVYYARPFYNASIGHYKMDYCEGSDNTNVTARGGATLANGNVAYHTAVCDGWTVGYSAGTGSLEVRDGGASGTLLTTIDTSLVTGSGNLWTSNALTYQSNQIHITSVGDTILDFVRPYVGNRTSGVRVWTVSRTGATSTQYATTSAYGIDFITNLQPDFVLICTGTNDTGSTPVNDLITAVQTACPSATVYGWVPPVGAAFAQSEADDIRTVYETAGVAKIEMDKLLPDWEKELTRDGVHPLASATKLMADILWGVMTGDKEAEQMRSNIDSYVNSVNVASKFNRDIRLLSAQQSSDEGGSLKPTIIMSDGTTGDVKLSNNATTLNVTGAVTVSSTLTASANAVINGTISGTAIDTSGTLSSNSDTKVASQKATKTYADTKAPIASPALTGNGSIVGSFAVGATLTAASGRHALDHFFGSPYWTMKLASADANATINIAGAAFNNFAYGFNAPGIVFGAGGATAPDTNLYRSAADTLKTDDTLIVGTAGTSAGSAVTIDGTQTLTNKTHTSPVINTGVSGTAIDTDATLTANSDTKLASQKAVKTYADTKVAGPASSTDNAVARFDGTTGKLAQNSVVTIGDTGNITTTGTTITLNTKNIVSGSGNLTLTDFNSVQIGSIRNDNGNLSTIGAVKVLEWSSNTSNPSARVTPTGASQKALVVKGLSSQTGNLQEWQDSSGTSLMSVSSAGALTTASDIEITDNTKGVILKSPDGTRWRVKIDNTGTLTTTSI